MSGCNMCVKMTIVYQDGANLSAEQVSCRTTYHGNLSRDLPGYKNIFLA